MHKHFAAILIALAAPATLTLSANAETGDVNGVQLHYTIHGEGRHLLLLHGYGSSGDDCWGKLLPEFAKSFTVIVPDLRGHGRSTFNSAGFTHEQAARDIFALLDHLKIQRIAGIGNSTGAMTMLHMATSHPARIESMVLHAGTTHFPNSARDIMRSVQANGDSDFGDYFGDARMRRVHSLGESQWRWIRENFNGMKDSYRDMNFSAPLLGTVQASTLIVHGDRDEFFPIEIPVFMYTNIPDSSLWIVPGQGHNGVFDPKRPGYILPGLAFVQTCVAHLRSADHQSEQTTEPSDQPKSR